MYGRQDIPEIQLLRDTFAGKIISEFWRPKNISEKWSEFYRQKCRAGVRTRLLFLVIIYALPWIRHGFPGPHM